MLKHGMFRNVLNLVSQNIQHALNASISLKESKKVRKLFEMILAFINYSTSARRGPMYGFKLSTLEQISRVTSPNTRRSLLEFLVSLVQRKFPEILNWDEDIRGLEFATKGKALESYSFLESPTKFIPLSLFCSDDGVSD